MAVGVYIERGGRSRLKRRFENPPARDAEATAEA